MSVAADGSTPGARPRAGLTSALAAVPGTAAVTRAALPRGRTLPETSWRRRHHALLWLLWLHVAALPVYGVLRGATLPHSLFEASVVASIGVAAVLWMRIAGGRTVAACLTSFGLLTSSALIVHLSHGAIEAHFHFFVMMSLLLLYEDWVPYLLAAAYVVLQHGIAGAISPSDVYAHAAGQAHPWRWAAIHGVFIVAAGAANVANWRLNEDARSETSQAYERTRHSEARKTAVLESALDCVIGMDHEGRITEFNPAAERTFGYVRADALGQDMAELVIPPALREAHRLGLARYLSGGPAPVLGKRIEIMAMRADGSEFPAELAINRIDLPGPASFTGYLRDITERRRIEDEHDRLLDQERRQNEQLRELDRHKDDFVASVSHELRTPLTSIRGYLELLREGEAGEVSSQQDEFLRIIDRNSDRLLRLVGDLLDVAHLNAGAEVNLEQVDLGALVADAVSRSRAVAESEGVDVAIVANGAVEIHADPGRMAQVIDNLLSNALKFTPPGGSVEVRVRTEEDNALVHVRDTGIGIAPEEIGRLFQRFFRTAAASQHAIQGTGLGLWITKAIVEAHGGSISVESEEGIGTTFTVALPREPATVSAQSSPEPMEVR